MSDNVTDDIPDKLVKVHYANGLTHLLTHRVPGDPGVVDSKILPIRFQCTKSLIALQSAAVRVVL